MLPGKILITSSDIQSLRYEKNTLSTRILATIKNIEIILSKGPKRPMTKVVSTFFKRSCGYAKLLLSQQTSFLTFRIEARAFQDLN